MPNDEPHILLRIFVDTFLLFHHHSVYKEIIQRARKHGLAGATAFLGLEGYQQGGPLLKEGNWKIGSDQEVVIEIIEKENQIESFLELIGDLSGQLLMTTEKVCIRNIPYFIKEEAMLSQNEGCLLRIMIKESDQWEGIPLYEALVEKARTQGLAGASVFRSILGYGKNSQYHAAGLLTLSTDQTILIELVDVETRIESFLKSITEMVPEGLLTTEKVQIHLPVVGETRCHQ